MRRVLTIGMVLMLAMIALPAHAAPGKEKGASAKAMEQASDEAIFNRVGDWFATVGKSDTEKAAIRAERRAKRTAKRAEQEAKRAERAARKEAKKAKKKLKKGLGDLGN